MNEDSTRKYERDARLHSECASMYHHPMIRGLRLLVGIPPVIAFGWYYLELTFFATPQTLSFGKRLICMSGVLHPEGIGASSWSLTLFVVCLAITAGFALALKRMNRRRIVLCATLFIMLLITPYLVAAGAIYHSGRPADRIAVITVDDTYKNADELIGKNKERYHRYDFLLGDYTVKVPVKNKKFDVQDIYSKLRKKARAQGADAIIVPKNLEEAIEIEYDFNDKPMGDYVVATFVFYKETKTAIPRLRKTLKSVFQHKRHRAIRALAAMKDPETIKPLTEVIVLGSEKDPAAYLLALRALSEMKDENAYAQVVRMAKKDIENGRNYVSVGMLENFEKKESLVLLNKMKQQIDANKRDKSIVYRLDKRAVEDAIRHIESL